MVKHFALFCTLIIMGCTSPDQPVIDSELWKFEAKNNNLAIDAACEPLMNNYLDLMTALHRQDTSYLVQKATILISLTDSLQNIMLIKDTLLQQNFRNGLLTLQAELNALILEKTAQEIAFSANMISLQLLNLLGNVGYQKQTIYIFNGVGVEGIGVDDGLCWLALSKKSINPYQTQKNEFVTAQKVLQEMN